MRLRKTIYGGWRNYASKEFSNCTVGKHPCSIHVKSSEYAFQKFNFYFSVKSPKPRPLGPSWAYLHGVGEIIGAQSPLQSVPGRDSSVINRLQVPGPGSQRLARLMRFVWDEGGTLGGGGGNSGSYDGICWIESADIDGFMHLGKTVYTHAVRMDRARPGPIWLASVVWFFLPRRSLVGVCFYGNPPKSRKGPGLDQLVGSVHDSCEKTPHLTSRRALLITGVCVLLQDPSCNTVRGQASQAYLKVTPAVCS